MTSLEVRPLRLEVLRAGMVNQTVHFDGDDDPTTIHLGAFDQDQNNVGVSTWMQRPFPLAEELKALQLRGMATAVNVQGQGIGALLLVAGQSHGREIGAHLIWANARDAALVRKVGARVDDLVEEVVHLLSALRAKQGLGEQATSFANATDASAEAPK